MTMNQVLKANGAAHTKLPPDTVRLRIANACVRLARRNAEARQGTVADLLQKAVDACLASYPRHSVRHSYRQLEWTLIDQGVTLDALPSESTFRRRVNAACVERFGLPRGKVRAVAPKDLEALVMKTVLATFEIMPDRTLRLRSKS